MNRMKYESHVLCDPPCAIFYDCLTYIFVILCCKLCYEMFLSWYRTSYDLHVV